MGSQGQFLRHSFFIRRNMLCLLSRVRVKRRFWTSSIIILTMCLSGRSLRKLAGWVTVPDSVISSYPINKYKINSSHVSLNLFPPFHPRSALFTFPTHLMYHYLHQNIFLRLSQNMTILPHTIHHCQLIHCFLQTQHVHQLLCIPLFYQLYTAHRPYHRSFCSSQNSYFIFCQTPRFPSI